jgi:target of EGR1 protein 1
MRCGKSHDLDLILDAEEKERDSKRRRRQKHEPPTVEAQTLSQPETAVIPGSTVELPEGAGLASAKTIITPDADDLTNTTSCCTTAATTVDAQVVTDATTALTQPQSTTVPQQPTAESSASAPISMSSTVSKETENMVQPGEKFHSAYYDAFMTGTIFLHQLHHHEIETVESQARNKIYLIGKSFPLNVEKSTFTKYSPSHERQRA